MRRIALVVVLAVVAAGAFGAPASLHQRLRDRDPDVRLEAVREVRAEPTFDRIKEIVPLLDDDYPYVRDLVWAALAEIRDPAWLEWVEAKARGHRSARMRRGAVEAIGRTGMKESLAALRSFAADDDAEVRESVAVEMARFKKNGEARDVVARLVDDRDPGVRAAAFESLSVIDARAAVPDLRTKGLVDEDDGVRCVALRALRYGDRDAAVEEGAKRLREGTWRECRQAIENAVWLRTRKVVPGLIEALDRVKRPAVRAELFDALRTITHLDHPPTVEDWKGWWSTHGEEWLKGGKLPRAPLDRPYAGPSYHRLPVVSRRVVFVCDASGSMKRTMTKEDHRVKLDVVKEELLGVLDRATGDFRFNVIFLQDDPRVFRPKLAKLGRRTRRDLEGFFRKFRAQGKTNVYDALDIALRDDDVDTIYFLSDGAPSAGEYRFKSRILFHVRHLNRRRKIRIHTISYAGKNLDQDFMRDLAKQNGGRAVSGWNR